MKNNSCNAWRMDKLRKRKTIRLAGVDYNQNHVIFLTICTKERRCILSRIINPIVVGTDVLGGPQNVLGGPQNVLGGPRNDLGGPQIQLTKKGEIVNKYINQLNEFYNDISVESYVIMPNHVHLMLWIKGDKNELSTPVVQNGLLKTSDQNGPSGTSNQNGPPGTSDQNGPPGTSDQNGPPGTSVPTATGTILSRFISTLKRFCNKEFGENLWQNRSHDHIIRNRKDYEEHMRYIYENPIRWHYDELYEDEE